MSKGDPALATMDTGEAKLRAMGYTQEFNRSFNVFTNFAVSFSIISILTGITGSFGLAFNNGGPVPTVWGWVLVTSVTMSVGLAMAEIVSSLPSSGGPYFWASRLGGKHGPFLSWITGWFNLLGQVAVTASIVFSNVNQISSMISLSTGYSLKAGEFLAVYAGILIAQGLMNLFSSRILAYINAFSVFWHVAGVAVLIILLPAVAPTRQPASYVFGQFNVWQTLTNGITNNGYLFLIGMLMSQFTITGFDACSHMSEETKGADLSAPRAIIMSIGASAIVGWGYILALVFSIQSPDDVAAAPYPSGEIFYAAFQARYGHGGGGIVAMGIPAIAMYLAGFSSLCSNSRMIWSFARDKGMPASFILSKVNRFTKTPINAVVLAACVAFLLGLPVLKSAFAFGGVVSISTIGLYISYTLPILGRLTLGRKTFERGPFHLGVLSDVVGWIAVLWVAFITVIFVLPTAYPVTSTNLNYAPVAVGIVLLWSIFSWFVPVLGARHWYKGAVGEQINYEEASVAPGSMIDALALPKMHAEA